MPRWVIFGKITHFCDSRNGRSISEISQKIGKVGHPVKGNPMKSESPTPVLILCVENRSKLFNEQGFRNQQATPMAQAELPTPPVKKGNIVLFNF